MNEVVLDIKVIPRARRTELAGTRGDAVLIRLAAPPVDGAANVALIDLLSEVLDVPRRDIVIVAGETARQKRVKITGLTSRDAQSRLARGSHRRKR